ncbi:hypothetical protein [Nocardiopsis deserti]|nr:hypothetical protein [Nocardiopsis deserti]
MADAGTRVRRLPDLARWDWPLQHITEHARTIMSGGVDELEGAAPGRV